MGMVRWVEAGREEEVRVLGDLGGVWIELDVRGRNGESCGSQDFGFGLVGAWLD